MPFVGRLPLLICTVGAALIGDRLLTIAPDAGIMTGTAMRARAIDRRMEQFGREANPHRS